MPVLSRTMLVVSLKAPYPGKPFSPGQTGMDGDPMPDVVSLPGLMGAGVQPPTLLPHSCAFCITQTAQLDAEALHD